MGKLLFFWDTCKASLPDNSNCRAPDYHYRPKVHRHRTDKHWSLVCVDPWPAPMPAAPFAEPAYPLKVFNLSNLSSRCSRSLCAMF